jgi:hypothetical protein
MGADPLFETETMADLLARQGRLGEARAIYQRLLATAPEASGVPRWQRRLRDLERRLGLGLTNDGEPPDEAAVPLPEAPGVLLALAEDRVTVAWSLPVDTVAPSLEVTLISRGEAGVQTTRHATALSAPSGRATFAAQGLQTALAAVGHRQGDRFVPVARGRAA